MVAWTMLYAVSLAGDADTMRVEGRDETRSYHAIRRQPDGAEETSETECVCCGRCGSAPWLTDPNWRS